MWTDEEDEELRALVAEYGQKKWAFICTKMSTGKGAKQCRRRWSNYLNNDLKQGGWSPEEDEILWNGHKQHGNKWTEIAKMVGGRTDNAVKNRHAVLVKKEEDRLAGGGASESSGKRKRRDADDRPSHAGGSKASKASKPTKTGSRQTNDQSTGGLPGSAVHFPGTATGPNAAANVAGWRPNLNLSVKIPTSSAEERGESNLPSAMTGGTSAPPSLEGLPTSASLTAAEIELLKQVQELISPHAEGLTLPAGGTARGGRGAFAPPPPQPHSPLDTPTVDLQQVMNWIMSVTPRAGANGAGAGAGRVTRASANAATAAAETPQGQHSVLLRKLLTEKLTGSPTGEAGRRRSPRSLAAGGEGGGDRKETHGASHTPVGLDLANAGGLMGGLPASLPVSPNFTSSELNLLMNALGGGGDTPTSGLMGGINPFGRASDSTDAAGGSGSKR